MAAKTKLIQRRLMYRQADNTEPPATSKAGKSTASSSGTNAGTENSREARHMMRRIASEFGSDASDLLKYNQLMVSQSIGENAKIIKFFLATFFRNFVKSQWLK